MQLTELGTHHQQSNYLPTTTNVSTSEYYSNVNNESNKLVSCAPGACICWGS